MTDGVNVVLLFLSAIEPDCDKIPYPYVRRWFSLARMEIPISTMYRRIPQFKFMKKCQFRLGTDQNLRLGSVARATTDRQTLKQTRTLDR